jgi:Mg2+ and Co2+ transporter CorA
MIERIKNELRSIEEALYHMDMNGIDDNRHYAKLFKKRRVLKRALRKLERLEGRKDGRA